MTDDVVLPGDVLAGGLGDELVDAVIEAYMRKGCVEAGHTNLEFDKKDGSDWVYRFKVSGAGDPEVVCDSGGNWRQRKKFYFDNDLDPGHDSVDAGDNSYDVLVFDAPGTWAQIRSDLEAWVYPFVHDCPSPNDFTDHINSMATVARQLYAGNAPAGGSEGAAPTSADPDLWDALSEIAISVDSRSLSVDAFQRTYGTDIWKTIGGQYAMVYSAGLALTAEAAAWNATYTSLRALIEAAKADFQAFAEGHPAQGQGRDAALGATGAVAGLLGATAGKVFPPFGLAMGVLSGSIAVARVMNPAVPAVYSIPLVLDDSSYESMWESFTKLLKTISTDQGVAEDAVGAGCRAMVDDVSNFPDNYSLTRGGSKGQGYQDDFEGMLHTTIDISQSKLKKVAGACEAIGNQQIGLAGILGGNDGAGASSASVLSEWQRGTLPEDGIIGSGYYGPYWDYRHLVEASIDLLLAEGKNSNRVSDWLIEAVLGLASTDADRAAELAALEAGFDRHPLAVGNDPTNPLSIT